MKKMLFYNDTKHARIYQMISLGFVISLGFGEVVSIAGIKLSYIFFGLVLAYFFGLNRGEIILSKSKKKIYRLLSLFLLWMVYPIIQLLWVKDIGLWLSFYRALVINLLVITLLLNYIDTWGDWMWISKAFVIFQMIMILVGYWEIYTGHHLILLEGELNLIKYAARPMSFYGNGNDSATVLFFCLCNSLVYLFAEKRNFIKKVGLLVLISATIHQIVIIDARGATYSIFLLIPFVIYFCIVVKLRKFSVANERWFEIITIGIAIIAVIAIFEAHPIQYYFLLYSGSGNYGSDLGRLELIKNGFEAFKESAFLGTGPGQSILASGINLHFFYLEMLFEYGLFFGGLMLAGIFISAFCKHSEFPMVAESILRSVPFVLTLTGVSSSKTFILRPTWVLLTLLFASLYVKPRNQEKESL